MDWNKAIIAAIGLTITILSTFGVVTASEGTELTAQATTAFSGVLGLVTSILAIVKRHKGDGNGEGPKAA